MVKFLSTLSEYDKIVALESRGSKWIVGTKASTCSQLALVRIEESNIT